MKETLFNLQHDWDGILDWHGVHKHEDRRKIKKMIAYEVDVFRNQNWYKRLLNKLPEWYPFDKL